MSEFVRELKAAVGWEIELTPLKKLDKLMDELQDSMLGNAVSRFENDLDDASGSAKKLGKNIDEAADQTERLGSETAKATTGTRRLGSAIRHMGSGIGSAYKRLHEYTDGFSRLRSTASNALASVRGGFARLGGNILRAPFTLPGMLAGGAAAYGGGKLIGSTIGGAANLELQSMQLEALVGDAQKAQKLFNDMNDLGAVSTFSEGDFLEGAKAFLPLTKDLDQINQLVKLQERFAASNTNEGMEGAAFSLREALSGDTVSMAERFNVPKSMLQNLKKATSMNDKIKAMDDILNKMGYTQEYLTKVNEAAASQWDNLGANIQMKFARAGTAALKELKPFLKDLNAFLQSDRASRMFDRLGQMLGKAAREAAKFGEWLIDKGGRAFDYIDRNYLSNPEFQKLPFNKQIETVFADIEQKFSAWYNNSGKETIEEGAQKFVEFTLGVLGSKSNIDSMISIGSKLGGSLASGLIAGLEEAVAAHPLLSAAVGFAVTPGPLQAKAVGGATVLGGSMYLGTKNKNELVEKYNNNQLPPEQKTEFERIANNMKEENAFEGIIRKISGKSIGMPFVPKNDTLYRLHRGERVLTEQENRKYTKERYSSEKPERAGSNQLNPTINIYGANAAEKGGIRRQVFQALDEYFEMIMRVAPQVTEG
ncbi:hypothetical protein ACFCW7_23235 [Paenibacillus glucanolyticus]|uniref:hypothetical protein n=1 Tax=Paenibacillus glucanolyticus TaxID=59843 RepID=UPI0035DB171A